MARPRSCRETRGTPPRSGDAKKRPPKPASLNSLIAKHERLTMSKIKVHSLTGRITARLMRQAFQAVKRNRGAAGVDRVSIKMFAANLEDNLTALMREMKDGSFRPLPLRRVYIDKGPGTTKKRPLGIPVVRDRVRKRWFEASCADFRASVSRAFLWVYSRTQLSPSGGEGLGMSSRGVPCGARRRHPRIFR